jgi:hypothetical protein
MQVMPSTAANPGFGITPAQSNTPAEYDRVGREYRAALQDKYGGNLARMWGAYIMGPGNMDKALAKYGDDWLSHVPGTVRSYVASNLKDAGAL